MYLRISIILLSVFYTATACQPKKQETSLKEYQAHISEELEIPQFDFVLIGQIVEELHRKPYYSAPMNLPKSDHFSKRHFLKEGQLKTFLQALTSDKNNSLSADCFFPSHSLIFYQKDKALAHLWICTSCRVFNLYLPDGSLREISPDTELMRELLEAHDMTYFTKHWHMNSGAPNGWALEIIREALHTMITRILNASNQKIGLLASLPQNSQCSKPVHCSLLNTTAITQDLEHL